MSLKCCELAFELAIQNGIDMPASWVRVEKAGCDWFMSFRVRHHLSCCTPEATSLGRATAFNRYDVGEGFNNLTKVMDRDSFPPHMSYNMDETCVTTVQPLKQIVTEKSRTQVDLVTSAERGELVTVACAVNATGKAAPPTFIFPCVHFKDKFIMVSLAGSIGHATESGWMNEEAFVMFQENFLRHTNCSIDHTILLILDDHKSHISLKAVTTANENGIAMPTVLPHTSHCLTL